MRSAVSGGGLGAIGVLEGMTASGPQCVRNRCYDLATGLSTQPDPIGLAGGLNLYGYAGGDPINRRDPFGLSPDTLESVTVEHVSKEIPTQAVRSVCVDKSVAGAVRNIFAEASAAGIPATMNNAYRGGFQAGTGGRPSGGSGSAHLAGFAFDINSSALTPGQLAEFTRIAGTHGFSALAGDAGHYVANVGAAAVYGSHQAGVSEAARSYAAGECVDQQEAATVRSPE